MINQLESGLVGEIFVDKNTAFVVEKYNPKDLVEKEIGDSKTPDKFIPQQKVMRWDNEVNFSVRLVHDEKTPDVVIEGDSVVWRGEKVEAKFYDVFNEEHPEGAGEFEIILKEKPTTNVVEFSLNTKGLDFFYQPALTPEEVAEGSERPENVIGSYAVYASEQKTNWVGGKEYKCGKVGHIYRPKIIDSIGTEVWGDLHIENGILSVTIPQDFLDKAVYPVRHAAGLTFGYTSVGATSSESSNNIVGASGSPASSGTVTKMSVYYKTVFATKYNTAIYTSTPTLLASGTEETSETVNAWNDLVLSASVTGGASYYVVAWANTGGAAVAGDTGSSGQVFQSATYSASWPTLTGTSSTVIKSVYATYTASGGGEVYVPRMGFIMHNNPGIA